MIFYAIREKSTGFFMPQLRKRKGYTGTEPQKMGDTVPRLFTTRTGASNSLRWWLDGIHIVHYSEDGDEDWDTRQPDTPRLKDNMEIVEMELTVHE